MKSESFQSRKKRYLSRLKNWTPLKENTFIILLLLLCPLTLVAQAEVPFQAQKKIYIKGGSIFIGNTILGKDRTEAFDNEKEGNDVVNMQYVDVDDDDATFSSSAAEILIPETSSEIVYAGLYWSALYPAEKTSMQRSKTSIKYKNKGERNPDIDLVRIKVSGLPYKLVEGEVIFDANKSGEFKNDSPYSCRADVTEYFKSLEDPNGLFTVANIKAVQGMPQGGSAGGWLLYVVYKDATQPSKYFTTYDGFRQVNKKGLEITFDDFQAKTTGPTTSTLVMGAMEGDIKIKTDNCAIFNEATQRFVLLETPERAPNNFFKSAITGTSKRVPSSKNTLGYDLIKTKLPDGIITNKSQKSLIKFSTKADRFYLLFTAFETEIDESFLSEKNKDTSSVEVVIAEEEVIVNDSVIAVVEEEKILVLEEKPKAVQPEEVTKPRSVPVSTKTKRKAPKKKVRRFTISGMDSGYYLVTNVFSQAKLAENWKNKLLNLGYTAQSYINPRNNWTYIYIEKSDVLSDILESKEALRVEEMFKDAWVAGINK